MLALSPLHDVTDLSIHPCQVHDLEAPLALVLPRVSFPSRMQPMHSAQHPHSEVLACLFIGFPWHHLTIIYFLEVILQLGQRLTGCLSMASSSVPALSSCADFPQCVA